MKDTWQLHLTLSFVALLAISLLFYSFNELLTKTKVIKENPETLTVLFDLDSSVVKDSSFVDKLSSVNSTILIVGYTDSSGTEQENMLLSLQRAENVAHFLKNKTLIVAGSSSRYPKTDNSSEQNRALNRRVVIFYNIK